MTETSIENVSDTAFGVAHFRALETERADALFRASVSRCPSLMGCALDDAAGAGNRLGLDLTHQELSVAL